jgi:hypothetical protein
MTTAALTVTKLTGSPPNGAFLSQMGVSGLKAGQKVTLELSAPDRTLFVEAVGAEQDGTFVGGATTNYLLAEWAGTTQKITLSVWSHRVGQGTPLATAEQDVAL